ncbi:hypothetical protein [Niveispirillum sp. KHB5.9]|uniref:hypothetical protein n=1 Tax=Niveispirillum sp. KHB5.9 TaxID=3400269 RepID=UPI003A8A5499
MIFPEIERDFLRCCRRVGPRHMGALAALGVEHPKADTDDKHRLPLWGAHAIEVDPNTGLFEFSALPAGSRRAAVIVPIGIGDRSDVWWIHIDDLVGFYLDRPDEWWLHRGVAYVLGADHIEDAGLYGAPVQLLATPLEWLQAGGIGAVVLDWRLCPAHEFGGVPSIEAATRDLAEHLAVRHAQTAQHLPITWRGAA